MLGFFQIMLSFFSFFSLQLFNTFFLYITISVAPYGGKFSLLKISPVQSPGRSVVLKYFILILKNSNI